MQTAASAAPEALMKKLAVHYYSRGEDWQLGLLADDGGTLLFEYAQEALTQGLKLSSLHLKLRAQAYGGFPDFQHRLPGLIADALPDGGELSLMDRLFRQQGLRHPGPLDRRATARRMKVEIERRRKRQTRNGQQNKK
jgi:serine/threonine-protein kinase HipA